MCAANFQTENPRTCYKGEKGGKMLIESLLATKKCDYEWCICNKTTLIS